MESQYLEFLGNCMTDAAKGQKQMADMAEWVREGVSGFEKVIRLFLEPLGANRTEPDNTDYIGLWTKTWEGLTGSYSHYLGLFGIVPQDQYVELDKKYQALKEKSASQDETIMHLRMLASETRNEDYERLNSQFEELIQKQADQFKILMKSFDQLSKSTSSGKKARSQK